ncbi:MAG: hypothetical protein WCE38_18075 [Burkholderiales bacterium]
MIRALSKSVVLLTVAALFATLSALGMAADEKPDATLRFSGTTIAVGVTATWGEGTLHFRGRDYPFKAQGIGLMGVGESSFKATGEIYHLTKVEDVGGSYVAVSAAAALAQGGLATTMQNEHGVVIRMKSTSSGVQLKAAVESITLELGTTGQ